MRKVFMSVIIAVLCVSGCASASIEQDIELHRVIGGLYSLVCAANINDNSSPHVNQLRQYFAKLPDDWHNQVQLSRVNDSVWVGINVGKYSTARRYLRANAQAMGFTESPEGYAWLGGDYVWVNISDVKLSAARGTGQDSGLLFLSADDGATWWLTQPVFTDGAEREILRRYGVKNAPELHMPSGVQESIYESVKPYDPVKPQEIRMSRKKSSMDMDIELGKDVILNPIPNTHRR